MIINLTPHDLTFIQNAVYNPSIRKYQGGQAYATIPSSGMVSARFSQQVCAPVDGIPVITRVVQHLEPIENYNEQNIYVVSLVYANAAKELHLYPGSLYTPGDLVVAEDGRTPLGCTCLIRQS